MITAKELDNETSYTYFGARYYDSDLSIWLSVDPMSDKYPSTSAYMYGSGNPVILRDPNGMDWVESENGDITWRNDINKDNYIDLLKEGEIYRGITYARTKEWNNNRYKGTVVEVYRSDGSGLDYYTPNEFGMYRFPEAGRGFERYTNPDGSNNGNNENYYINNEIQHADNYISGTAFANFYNTIQDFYNEKKTYRFIVTNDIVLEPQENGKYGIIAGLAESNYNFIILSLNKIGFNDITNDDLKNAKVINKYGKLKFISVSKNDLMQIDEIEEYNLDYMEKYIKGRDDAGYTEFNIKYPFLTDEQRIHGVGAHEETHLMPQNIEYQEKNDYYNSEKEAYENEIRERSEYIKENNIQY
jgi:RHS repeat-associated protein